MAGGPCGVRPGAGGSRSTTAAVTGVALGMITLLGGCADSGSQVGDRLQGTWESPGGAVTVFSDGAWETSAPGVGERPFDEGTYEVDGARLTMTTALTESVVRSDFTCEEGAVGVYEVTFSDDGSVMTMELVRDDCDGRASEAGAQVRVGR